MIQGDYSGNCGGNISLSCNLLITFVSSQCARCQNVVRVLGAAKAGNFSGQFYLHVCTYNLHFAPLLTTSIQFMNCRWHYMFSVGISPRNTAFPTPVSRHTGLGILQPNEKNACSGHLSQLFGRSAHRFCGNWCCCTCCIINGGCHLQDHKETQLSKNRRQKFNRLTAITPPLPSLLLIPNVLHYSCMRTPQQQSPLPPPPEFLSLRLKYLLLQHQEALTWVSSLQ